MKTGRAIGILLGLLLVVCGVAVFLGLRPDPADLTGQLRVAAARDWSADAKRGVPEAEFLFGLSLVRSNLIITIDRVPFLSALPVVGPRFESVTYRIDTTIDTYRLREAHRWIERAAAIGFPPAVEARKLFVGRVPAPGESEEPAASAPRIRGDN